MITVKIDTKDLQRAIVAAAVASGMIRRGEVEISDPDLAEKAVARADEVLRAVDRAD